MLINSLCYLMTHPIVIIPIAFLVSLVATFYVWRWDKDIEKRRNLKKTINDLCSRISDLEKDKKQRELAEEKRIFDDAEEVLKKFKDDR